MMMHADEGQRTEEHHDGTDRFPRQIIASFVVVAATTSLRDGPFALKTALAIARVGSK